MMPLSLIECPPPQLYGFSYDNAFTWGTFFLFVILLISLHNLISKRFNHKFRERLYNWVVFLTVGAALLNIFHHRKPHALIATFVGIQAVFMAWRVIEKRFIKKD